MDTSPGNHTLDDREQPDDRGPEPPVVSPYDGSRLAQLLCLMPIAFSLFTWSLVGARSLEQTSLSFVVSALVLALMVGLRLRR